LSEYLSVQLDVDGISRISPHEIPPDIVKRDHGGITERQMTRAVFRKYVRVVSKILRDTLSKQTRNLLCTFLDLCQPPCLPERLYLPRRAGAGDAQRSGGVSQP